MWGKVLKRSAVIAIVLMFFLPASTYFSGSDLGDADTFENGAGEDIETVAKGGGGTGTMGLPLETISAEFEIPAGKQYYVYYDNATNQLIEMKASDERAGLPSLALQAIDLSPNWLKPNITRKLGHLAEIDIDIGLRSNPAFSDIDNDGDIDLMVGENGGIINYFENVDEGYHYYEGYDYFINAVYAQNSSLFAGIDAGSYSDPSFADLDGDNDVDMMLGDSTGELAYYERIPAGWAAPVTLGINVSGYSAPYLVDFEGDSDYDLFVGCSDGLIYYSENNSVTFGPLAPIQIGPADIDVGSFSNPAAVDFFDDDGDFDLVVGAQDGRIRYYRYDDGAGTWSDASSTPGLFFSTFDLGSYSSPALADMDSNLVPDIAIGENTGYLFYRENIGTAASPEWLVWTNPLTAFDRVNIRNYYADDSLPIFRPKIKYRAPTARLIEYSQMIVDVAASDIRQVDEIVFTIAHSSVTGLTNMWTHANAYKNNTEALYYNDQFLDYANILDFNLGTADQWSTVEYWINESGRVNRYVHPRNIYYWYIVHPKISDELVTLINPLIPNSGHGGASPSGKFWRWSTLNEADTVWPPDPISTGVKYPKDSLPPLLRTNITGVTTMWDRKAYNSPAIYNNSGFDTGARPWDYKDHAIEKVTQWVERTLPLNAQEVEENIRPRQPARIQWEHNGNCGELGDLTAAVMRSALIPTIEHVSYPEDHCWNHFYERGWHGLDNQWSASTSVVDYGKNVRYWNRDWSGIAATRGDTKMFDITSWEHSTHDANGDGFQDRGNVSVVVRDPNGYPVDGVKVAIADWSWRSLTGEPPDWHPLGSQWTYTNSDGRAYFYTSESRQKSQGDNDFNDGLMIHIASKLGGGTLNQGYSSRFQICVDPLNLPLYEYFSDSFVSLTTTMPRPHPPVTQTAYAGGGQYLMRAGFSALYGVQHPPNALGVDDGDTTYHEFLRGLEHSPQRDVIGIELRDSRDRGLVLRALQPGYYRDLQGRQSDCRVVRLPLVRARQHSRTANQPHGCAERRQLRERDHRLGPVPG
jgi:hypothetical protein